MGLLIQVFFPFHEVQPNYLKYKNEMPPVLALKWEMLRPQQRKESGNKEGKKETQE